MKHVIHTVGPIWHGGRSGEEELLRKCYQNSLDLAEENGLKSIAFPSISTGAYNFPIEKASRVAVDAVRAFLRETSGVERIVFVCYSRDDFEVYLNQLGAVSQEIS